MMTLRHDGNFLGRKLNAFHYEGLKAYQKNGRKIFQVHSSDLVCGE